jgi:hypothetical protein
MNATTPPLFAATRTQTSKAPTVTSRTDNNPTGD